MKYLSGMCSPAVAGAMAIAGASLLFSADSAGADTAAPAIPLACTGWNQSSDIVYVYAEPSTNSAAWGYLWPGLPASCAYTGASSVWGTHHNLCGGGSLYVAIYYRVSDGWVIAYAPDACVRVAY